MQGVEPKGSETVGTRWKSGSIGKPGRRQAKTQRKTREDRTKNSERLKPKASGNRFQSEEKSTKNRSKTSKNRRKIGFSCLCQWALRVVPSRSGVAQERAWDGLRTPSWLVLAAKLAVLTAKLAVLAAMLAVLGAKLAARDAPNDAQSRLGALFERMRQRERRSYRFFHVLW